MKNTSIILAVQNNLAYTQQCVAVLQNSLQGQEYELIVVDDASDDGTTQWLSQQTGVQFLSNRQPVGRAASFNQGAVEAVGDSLLFLSNEVLLFPEAFQRMQQMLWQEEKTGAVGPLSNVSRYLQRLEGADYQTFDELEVFVRMMPQRIAGSNIQPTFFLEDFCLLVKHAAWEKVGGFDPSFAGKGILADGDLGFRLLLAGYWSFIVRHAYVHREKPFALSRDLHEAMKQGRSRFEQKWQLHIDYSCNIRQELLAHVEVQKPGLALLEAGCACGGNLMQLRHQNPQAELYGIELNEHSAKIAACFGKIYTLDLEKFSMPEWENKFDAILMGDILEHLYDPWQVVRNMYGIVKAGGRIILSVPNIMHISIFHSLLHGQWTYASSGLLDRTHLRFFTKQEAIDLLEQAGWKVNHMEYLTVPESDAEQRLVPELIRLLGQDILPEQLNAYQWILVAEK